MPERSAERERQDALLVTAEQWVTRVEEQYQRIAMRCLTHVRQQQHDRVIDEYLAREDITNPTFEYARGNVANDLLRTFGYRYVLKGDMILILYGNCDICNHFYNAPFWRDSSIRLAQYIRQQVKIAPSSGLDLRRISEKGDHRPEYHYLFVGKLAETGRNITPYV